MKITKSEVDRAVPCSMLRIIAACGHLTSTSSAERPIHLALAIAASLVILSACETSNYVPPVTPAMVSATYRKQHVDAPTLARGRQLFAHRCIECHTLPPIWKYSREDWPQIVNEMSHRASLKAGERDAVIANILAARKQER
ncbi:MAG TPA: hypothetical protein VLK27_11295 [Chthoniobacterales bacterium]|nr:hypothetical protein [Chthoniobacterales bacterium]